MEEVDTPQALLEAIVLHHPEHPLHPIYKAELDDRAAHGGVCCQVCFGWGCHGFDCCSQCYGSGTDYSKPLTPSEVAQRDFATGKIECPFIPNSLAAKTWYEVTTELRLDADIASKKARGEL